MSSLAILMVAVARRWYLLNLTNADDVITSALEAENAYTLIHMYTSSYIDIVCGL